MGAKNRSKKNNPSNMAYKSENRAVKNKAKKAIKHGKKHPNDNKKGS